MAYGYGGVAEGAVGQDAGGGAEPCEYVAFGRSVRYSTAQSYWPLSGRQEHRRFALWPYSVGQAFLPVR